MISAKDLHCKAEENSAKLIQQEEERARKFIKDYLDEPVAKAAKNGQFKLERRIHANDIAMVNLEKVVEILSQQGYTISYERTKTPFGPNAFTKIYIAW